MLGQENPDWKILGFLAHVASMRSQADSTFLRQFTGADGKKSERTTLMTFLNSDHVAKKE